MEKLKKILKNKYFPFIVCFFVMAVIFSTMYTGWGDEIHFVLKDGETVFGYLKTQYLTTHAKILTDLLILVMLSVPQAVWALVTAALYALLAWSIFYLLEDHDGTGSTLTAWFTVLLMLVYNFLDVTGAGWYATTINYVWPLACGAFSLLPIRHAFSGKTEKSRMLFWYVPAILIGCAQEQMAAIVFCFYLIFSVYLFSRKKLNKIVITELILSAASLAFLLSSPGNASRAQSEAQFWYPQFLTFSPVLKLYLGIITTAADLIFSDNPLVFVFILLFPVFVFRLSRSAFAKALSLLPLILTCVNNFFFPFFSKLYPMLGQIESALREFTISVRNRQALNDVHFSAILFAVAALYLLPVFLCTVASFVKDSEKTANFPLPGIAMAAGLIVLAGFASRFVIGFSPTMFASGPRTFVYLHFSFIAVLVLLFSKCRTSCSSALLFTPLSAAAALEILRLLYTGSLFN